MFEILGALSNAGRGSQWREWFNVKPGKLEWVSSDVANALIFGVTVYITSGHFWLAASSFAAMNIGARPGWGDYIGALGGWRATGLKENRFIDPLISWLKKYPVWWGMAGMTLRGIFWGAMLAFPFWLLVDRADVAMEFLWRGAMMGVVYKFAVQWAKFRAGMEDGRYQAVGWALGELLYGAVLWGALHSY